ncbi:RDD family protein [Pseudoduganella eburnea]|uniref:RDD family protein n=1 Tax=Massilia eburnea TaxID=1776165 RepID=A0A6L6QM03_9BURK|nr:RDD family protein [Massilia eburnea]MTW13185.1 RDD family protein [Massilia eburnea]
MQANNAVPTVRRRLISMVYEILLAFAALFLPFLVFEIATKASHTAQVEHLRQALAFMILGIYFIHQWTRKGQTLAMQTWRIKVVQPGLERLPMRTALIRYLLSWLWILPGIVVAYAADLSSKHKLYAMLVSILLWSLTAFLDKDRQFLHDRLAGTRLVQLPKPEKKGNKAA